MDESSSEGSVDEEEIFRDDEAKKIVQSKTYFKKIFWSVPASV